MLVNKQTEGCGAYVVRFFIGGTWKSVIVDDLIPAVRGTGGRFRPAFAHSGSGRSLWPAIVEKAYAKLCGSYQAVTGGYVHVGMAEMTGGVAERLDLFDDDAQTALADGSLWAQVKGYFDAVRCNCSI